MRFIILSDSKGKDHGINKKVLTKLLRETCKLTTEPDAIILGGDTIAGSHKERAVAEQFQTLRALIEKYHYGVPLIPVVGNHEVNNEPKDDSHEKIFSRTYNDVLPDTCLDGYNNTVYYRDYEDTRIIVLNTFHFGEIHKIGKRQLSWFKKAASTDIKNKIVFLHSPPFPTGAHLGHSLDLYPEERDSFWRVVEDCDIDIVFCGHEHNYTRRKIEGGKSIYQIITGGSGETLRDKFKDKEGVVKGPIAKYHFVILDIERYCIKVSAISSEGKFLDRFEIDKS